MSPRPTVERFVVVGVAIVVALTFVGLLRAGRETQRDVDEVLHADTLRAMRDGAGYYDAMDDALVAKQGVGASSIPTVRPPAAFVVLRFVPDDRLEAAGALVLLASGVLTVLLAREGPRWAPVAAGALAGLWIVHFAPHLYLHSEVWAAPFVLGAMLAVRARRIPVAALLLVAAALIREFSVIALLTGAVVTWSDRRSRPWWVGAVAVTSAYYVGHVVAASRIVSPDGEHPGYGIASVSDALFAVSPGSTLLAWSVGLLTLVAGGWGLVRGWMGHDLAARLAAPSVVVLLPLSVWSGRNYWTASWAFILVAFVPAGVAALLGDRHLPAEEPAR